MQGWLPGNAADNVQALQLSIPDMSGVDNHCPAEINVKSWLEEPDGCE